MIKKILLITIVATIGFGNYAYGRSWRVNSNTNAKADFKSVVLAIADEKVKANDTLYLEAGHVEGDITFTKKLHLIGPGYWQEAVPNNVSYSTMAVINGAISFMVEGVSITGCIIKSVMYNTSGIGRNIKVDRCLILSDVYITTTWGESDYTITNCFIKGSVSLPTMSRLIGCIMIGDEKSGSVRVSAGTGSVISNNVIIGNTGTSRDIYLLQGIYQSSVTNNIVINQTTYSEYIKEKDETFYYRNNTIQFDKSQSNTITYNVLGTEETYKNIEFPNNIYSGAKVEDIFVMAGNEEEQYMLKEGSVAKGAGNDGTDCGAYGGLRPYVKGGYPQFIPVIYDVDIPTNPTDGKLPVKFKIRSQND